LRVSLPIISQENNQKYAAGGDQLSAVLLRQSVCGASRRGFRAYWADRKNRTTAEER